MIPAILRRVATLALATVCVGPAAVGAGSVPVEISAYGTLQAAIDANPGRILRLPAGEFVLEAALVVTHDGTELHGPARLVQANPAEPILRIAGARRVRIAGLALSRREGRQEAGQPGVDVAEAEDVVLSGLRVSDNHTQSSIRVRDSRNVVVEDCVVLNYKGITVDDRTEPKELYGFAFRAIDGTGIQFRNVDGGAIRNNRIQEHRLWPTREVRDRHELGRLTVVPEVPGRLMDRDIFASKYTNNWHQGAGIQVAGPTRSRRIVITGNVIDHPAQGLDLHCDNVTVTANLVSHAMIGMKAMHGAKHVLIDGNQFSHCDLWGLLLMPGALSRAAGGPGDARTPPEENVDGGTVVSNNIFSNFGFGDQYWNWVDHRNEYPERNVIAILMGQLPENPPLRDVLITGNVVHDSGRDTVRLDGRWVEAPPRYFHALYVEQKVAPAPVNIRVHGNLFDPGLHGATNLPAGAAD